MQHGVNVLNYVRGWDCADTAGLLWNLNQLIQSGMEKPEDFEHSSQLPFPFPYWCSQKGHLIHLGCHSGLLPHPQFIMRVPWFYLAHMQRAPPGSTGTPPGGTSLLKTHKNKRSPKLAKNQCVNIRHMIMESSVSMNKGRLMKSLRKNEELSKSQFKIQQKESITDLMRQKREYLF